MSKNKVEKAKLTAVIKCKKSRHLKVIASANRNFKQVAEINNEGGLNSLITSQEVKIKTPPSTPPGLLSKISAVSLTY